MLTEDEEKDGDDSHDVHDTLHVKVSRCHNTKTLMFICVFRLNTPVGKGAHM